MVQANIEEWAHRTNNLLKEQLLDKKSIELKKTSLPIQAEIKGPLENFTKNLHIIEEFMKKYDNNIFIRLTPNEEGKLKGLNKDYKWGILKFEEVLDFIDSVAKNQKYYTLEIRERLNFTEGFIITSSSEIVRCELGKDLEKMQHSSDQPLCAFSIDLTKVGHLQDKICWHIKGEKAQREILLKALKYIKIPDDNFNPHFIRGYFEGLVSEEGRIKFFKFRKGEIYSI